MWCILSFIRVKAISLLYNLIIIKCNSHNICYYCLVKGQIKDRIWTHQLVLQHKSQNRCFLHQRADAHAALPLAAGSVDRGGQNLIFSKFFFLLLPEWILGMHAAGANSFRRGVVLETWLRFTWEFFLGGRVETSIFFFLFHLISHKKCEFLPKESRIHVCFYYSNV